MEVIYMYVVQSLLFDACTLFDHHHSAIVCEYTGLLVAYWYSASFLPGTLSHLGIKVYIYGEPLSCWYLVKYY